MRKALGILLALLVLIALVPEAYAATMPPAPNCKVDIRPCLGKQPVPPVPHGRHHPLPPGPGR